MKKTISFKDLYLHLIFIILSLNIYINFDILNFFVGDGLTYKNLALQLLNHFEYIEENTLRSWRPPGYSFFLFIIFSIFGPDTIIPIMIINNFLILLSFCLLNSYLKLLKINDCEILTFLSFLYFFYLFNTLLLQNWSEMLYFFFICSFIYVFMSGLLNNNKLIIFSFFILGMSALIRTPSLLFGIFFWFFIFFRFEITFKIKIICLFFFVIPILFWLLRNFYVLEYFPHTFTANYYNFFAGIQDFVDWEKIGSIVNQETNDIVLSDILKKNILVSLQNNFDEFIYVRIKNIIRYYFFSLAFIFSILAFTSSLVYILVFDFKSYFKMNKILLISFIFSNLYLIIICLAFYAPRFGNIPLFFINFFQICILFACVKKIYKKINFLRIFDKN